jgi:hypothetical protein
LSHLYYFRVIRNKIPFDNVKQETQLQNLRVMSISGPVLTFIAVAVYGALHSLLASNSVKQLSRRAFGQTSDRFYRFFFNIVGGLTFLPVLAIAALDPGQMLYQLTQPWVLLTSAGQALALAFYRPIRCTFSDCARYPIRRRQNRASWLSTQNRANW